jgi:hypothetical protein
MLSILRGAKATLRGPINKERSRSKTIGVKELGSK